jgi:hypothetical protein
MPTTVVPNFNPQLSAMLQQLSTTMGSANSAAYSRIFGAIASSSSMIADFNTRAQNGSLTGFTFDLKGGELR